MNTTLLKNQFQYSIPEELYSIEPGQIVYYISEDGLFGQEDLSTLHLFFRCLREVYKDYSTKVCLVPTHNELLIDTIAGRNPQETDTPYKVFVGASDSIAGIVSQFFGEDIDKVLERCLPSIARRSFTDTLPAIVEIDPENRPTITVQSQGIEQRIDSSYQSGFDMGMKLSKPEKGSAAESKLIAKEEKKLEKILRECAILGIELKIDRIKKKVEEDLKKTIDYKLIIKTKEARGSYNRYNRHRLDVCDIYVADRDDCKLDFTTLETAVYLAFLLYKDGIGVSDSYDTLRLVARKIYDCLPNVEKTQKADCFLDDNNDIFSYSSSLRSYFTHIREDVADKVPDPLIAQKFSIEGYSGYPYGIEMTTPEIRAQIKDCFGL